MEKEENLMPTRPTNKAGTKRWGGRNGIEPSSPGWSPGAFPWLCYSRVLERHCRTTLLHGRQPCQYVPWGEECLSFKLALRFDLGAPFLAFLREVGIYRARARTSVTSSGCSLSPIQFSTAVVTNWLIWGSGRFRLSLTRSISRCSPNSPKSFSGSVTPSL